MTNKKEVEKRMESRQKTIDEWFETCPVCNKEIVGSSPASAEHNLRVHLMTKHPKTENVKNE